MSSRIFVSRVPPQWSSFFERAHTFQEVLDRIPYVWCRRHQIYNDDLLSDRFRCFDTYDPNLLQRWSFARLDPFYSAIFKAMTEEVVKMRITRTTRSHLLCGDSYMLKFDMDRSRRYPIGVSCTLREIGQWDATLANFDLNDFVGLLKTTLMGGCIKFPSELLDFFEVFESFSTYESCSDSDILLGEAWKLTTHPVFWNLDERVQFHGLLMKDFKAHVNPVDLLLTFNQMALSYPGSWHRFIPEDTPIWRIYQAHPYKTKRLDLAKIGLDRCNWDLVRLHRNVHEHYFDNYMFTSHVNLNFSPGNDHVAFRDPRFVDTIMTEAFPYHFVDLHRSWVPYRCPSYHQSPDWL